MTTPLHKLEASNLPLHVIKQFQTNSRPDDFGSNTVRQYHNNNGSAHGINTDQHQQYSNAMQIVSAPGSSLAEKCARAFNSSDNAMSNNETWMISTDYTDENGDIPVCGPNTMNAEHCRLPGTVAVQCPTDLVSGIRGASSAPVIISVPQSEYDMDVQNAGHLAIMCPWSKDPVNQLDLSQYNYTRSDNKQSSYDQTGNF